MPLNERKLKSSSYEVIKEYKCVPCCEVFERKENLIEHICIRHDGKLYGCSQCQETFVYTGSATFNCSFLDQH